jgi:hypothetical protein
MSDLSLRESDMSRLTMLELSVFEFVDWAPLKVYHRMSSSEGNTTFVNEADFNGMGPLVDRKIRFRYRASKQWFEAKLISCGYAYTTANRGQVEITSLSLSNVRPRNGDPGRQFLYSRDVFDIAEIEIK